MTLTDRLRSALGDRYVIEREAGRGAAAVVFLAEDRKHGRNVAVKVLRPELATTIESDRFLREIRIAAGLHHPNILAVHDSGEADGLLYYVMPYVEGETLRTKLEREHALPLDDVQRIAIQACEALAHAHSRGVIHRDVKPENILLEGGHVLISDFGMARASHAAAERLTHSGAVVGTPLYLSPEQASGQDTTDGRSDIYSLGCVVYEMICGEPPFQGRTVQAVLTRHLLEQPHPISALRSSVPLELQRVIEKALAKTPADRFENANAFGDALRTGAHAPAASKVRRRPRKRVWIGAVALLAGLAAVVTWLAQHRSISLDPSRVVVFPLVATDGDESGPDVGLYVALAIGAALEHSAPLKWIDGWSRLSEDERADARNITPGIARRISRDRLARYYIDGAVWHDAEALVVTLRLHDASADTMIVQETVRGMASGMTPAMLGLEAITRILPSLMDPGRAVDLTALTRRTPAAIALFIQGEHAYRRSQFATGLGFFRRAVEADSLLAYAAVRGAQASSWIMRLTEAEQMIGVALQHDSLLPSKHRDFAHGLAAYLGGEADAAVAWFRKAVAQDSAWTESWMALGEVYYHLLPAEPQLNSLAEASFRRAAAIDSTFSPPFLHLTEIALYRGDTRVATDLLERLHGAVGDTTMLRYLTLAHSCVADSTNRFDWHAVSREDPAAVSEAGKVLTAGAAHLGCAKQAFRALLSIVGLPDSDRWGASLGLYAVLLAQGDHEGALTVLDSATAQGIAAAHLLYVFGAVAGAPFVDRAAAADTIARRSAGAYYERAHPSSRWLLALLSFRRGDRARFDSIARRERDVVQASVQQSDALVARALSAWAVLAAGDTSAAIDSFSALRPAGTHAALASGIVEPLALERFQLAELLLHTGRYQEALDAASVFDHPGPIIYLPLLPGSLVLRQQAARALNRPDLATRHAARLAALRWTDGSPPAAH